MDEKKTPWGFIIGGGIAALVGMLFSGGSLAGMLLALVGGLAIGGLAQYSMDNTNVVDKVSGWFSGQPNAPAEKGTLEKAQSLLIDPQTGERTTTAQVAGYGVLGAVGYFVGRKPIGKLMDVTGLTSTARQNSAAVTTVKSLYAELQKQPDKIRTWTAQEMDAYERVMKNETLQNKAGITGAEKGILEKAHQQAKDHFTANPPAPKRSWTQWIKDSVTRKKTPAIAAAPTVETPKAAPASTPSFKQQAVTHVDSLIDAVATSSLNIEQKKSATLVLESLKADAAGSHEVAAIAKKLTLQDVVITTYTNRNAVDQVSAIEMELRAQGSQLVAKNAADASTKTTVAPAKPTTPAKATITPASPAENMTGGGQHFPEESFGKSGTKTLARATPLSMPVEHLITASVLTEHVTPPATPTPALENTGRLSGIRSTLNKFMAPSFMSPVNKVLGVTMQATAGKELISGFKTGDTTQILNGAANTTIAGVANAQVLAEAAGLGKMAAYLKPASELANKAMLPLIVVGEVAESGHKVADAVSKGDVNQTSREAGYMGAKTLGTVFLVGGTSKGLMQNYHAWLDGKEAPHTRSELFYMSEIAQIPKALFGDYKSGQFLPMQIADRDLNEQDVQTLTLPVTVNGKDVMFPRLENHTPPDIPAVIRGTLNRAQDTNGLPLYPKDRSMEQRLRMLEDRIAKGYELGQLEGNTREEIADALKAYIKDRDAFESRAHTYALHAKFFNDNVRPKLLTALENKYNVSHVTAQFEVPELSGGPKLPVIDKHVHPDLYVFKQKEMPRIKKEMGLSEGQELTPRQEYKILYALINKRSDQVTIGQDMDDAFLRNSDHAKTLRDVASDFEKYTRAYQNYQQELGTIARSAYSGEIEQDKTKVEKFAQFVSIREHARSTNPNIALQKETGEITAPVISFTQSVTTDPSLPTQ